MVKLLLLMISVVYQSALSYLVFEHCVLDRYGAFFGSSDNQFGFKKNLGCIGADFRFEVPGQSSVGLIGGGRGQWLGGAP